VTHGPVSILILKRSEVEALLDLDRLVDAVAAALADLSEDRASMPPRVAAMVAERHGLLAAMPAFLPSARALTTKLVSLFPENRDVPTHQAVICCFDPATGTPLALMDGTAITASRTAAGSALATRLLARADAHVVAIVGTGVQGRAHALALARDRRVQRMLLAGRDAGAAQALVAELANHVTVPLEAARSIEAAVREADVVCLATHAADPVIKREWLRPGVHVNSVGYNSSGRGELDGAILRDGFVVVESRASALAPAPAGAVELNRAIAEGLITTEHVRAELGELVTGRVTGRTDASQLTVYKSVGVAVEDAAAAALVLEAARDRGVGIAVEL
jgi:alanine dehydrogenase